jgi:O-antigen ligase
MLTEQGIVGFLIFVISIFTILYQIDQLYFKANNEKIKNLTLTLGASFVILLINLLFSDLIETAKNGFFFFFISAILIRIASWNKNKL